MACEPPAFVPVTPTLEQSKLVLSIAIEATAQLSVEPASTSAAVMLASPFASRYKVKSCAMAIDDVVSSTVTVAAAVALLPFTSVTVKLTVLEPTSVHEKVLTSILNEAIPQASVELLFTSAAVIEAVPLASK